MASPSQQTLAVFELTEAILFHLDNPVDIVRMQRVCRRWRDIITISPLLQEACWYRPFSNLMAPGQLDIINSTSTNTEKGAEKPIWKVNPAFERVGMQLNTRNGPPQEHGGFNLQTRVYDKPGSWTTMLATQPPRTQVEFDIDCYQDDSGEQSIYYWIQSTGQPLLVGDIMAVLAECQNRQEWGVDRWYADIEHRDGDMLVGTEKEWLEQRPDREFEEIPDDVSIKVAFAKNTPWSGWCPAFSVRRLESSMAAGMNFLHEMQLYAVAAVRGKEYERHDGNGFTPVCSSGGEYQANLVVVRDCDHPYLEDCRHIYRLLSDV